MTAEQVEQIIELRLDRVRVVDVAEQVGCNKDTVTAHWQAWLDQTTEERRANLERKRSEVIGRLDSVAALARRAARDAAKNADLDADQASKAVARFLGEERQALKEMSRIAGWDAPTKIATTFTPEMSEEEAARILAELDGLPS